MDFTRHRDNFIKWVTSQLTGPTSGPDEILTGIAPCDRYPTGALAPVIKGLEGLDPASAIQAMGFEVDVDQETDSDPSTSDEADPQQKRYRYTPPSSSGFSFFITGTHVRFQVQAFGARYEPPFDHRDEYGQWITRQWQRIELNGPDGDVVTFDKPFTSLTDDVTSLGDSITLCQEKMSDTGVDMPWADGDPLEKMGMEENATHRSSFRIRHGVLQDKAEIDIIGRPHDEGWIITVTLCNTQKLNIDEIELGSRNGYRQFRNRLTLFQVGLVVTLEKGVVGSYPRVDPALLSPEEAELELQYHHRHIYAVGHGVAVDWREKEGRVREIRTEFIPQVEVPQVTADTGDDPALNLSFLAGFEAAPRERIEKLTEFVSGYSTWVENQKKRQPPTEKRANPIPYQEKTSQTKTHAAERILRRMEKARKRMEKGVTFLEKNPMAGAAFGIANQAMLNQMVQNDTIHGKKRLKNTYQWRPFQLAFFLTVLESAASPESLERDLVDLIWFPTGGGKTESYLGVAAFVIALRRMTSPASGGGTSVIMRYTLRLLTAQQYLRATRLICALELIRRNRNDLGKTPITIGMWVGNATSPNRTSEAVEQVDRMMKQNEKERKAPSRLVLTACPWCGTPFLVPENYHTGHDSFFFTCTHSECELVTTRDVSGNHPLPDECPGKIPCQVVDEMLYAEPPTFLIATIDKFARLAWEPRTSVFFGKEKHRPPELIIQDELHLIAGALGSVAGIYEAGIFTILTHRGMIPKYLASTATIRMADDQVARLYGAEVSIFPPPGLSCDDAYFAKTVPLNQRPGRTFLGYLSPFLSRRECMAPLVGALLAAPENTFTQGQIDREMLLDAWWTLVVYHGSLKGVGISHNLFNTKVQDIFRRLVDEGASKQPTASTHPPNQGDTLTPKKRNRDEDVNENSISRTPNHLAQLTSIPTAEENAATFARLERSRKDEGALDAVLATNMISVGLDVARLALMVINGQPLTTAEYIQAASRVGRDKVPGIVFTNYYRDQARSLSHYENFRAFHDAFYRFVEPTSITPFTYQARRRALHAALVIALRHGDSTFLENDQAGHFDPDAPGPAKIVQRLKQRCAKADPERADEITAHIDRLARKWVETAKRSLKEKRRLVYWAPDKIDNDDRLIHNHGDKIKGIWPTLQSMRNVEHTALLKIIK